MMEDGATQTVTQNLGEVVVSDNKRVRLSESHKKIKHEEIGRHITYMPSLYVFAEPED